MSVAYTIGVVSALWVLFDIIKGVSWFLYPVKRSDDPLNYKLVTLFWIVITISIFYLA